MSAAIAIPGSTASTFLVHFFGTGLSDKRFAVERFKAHADGDIRPWPGEEPAKKGRRGARRITATLEQGPPRRGGLVAKVTGACACGGDTVK